MSYPRCTENENYFDSDCGSASWAYGLFISWNIISMSVPEDLRETMLIHRYIFMNMFTGVVVESFAYVYQRPGGVSVNREELSELSSISKVTQAENTRGIQESLVIYRYRAYRIHQAERLHSLLLSTSCHVSH